MITWVDCSGISTSEVGSISTGNKREKEGGREGLMILHVSVERAVNVFDKNTRLQNFSEACWD